MSVLAKLIEERQEWVTLQKAHQARRNRMVVVEFGAMLALGLFVVVYYNKIQTAVMAMMGQ